MLVVLIELASVITTLLMTNSIHFYTLPGVLVFIIVCVVFSIRVRPHIGLTHHK
jgi:hypothetical protein